MAMEGFKLQTSCVRRQCEDHGAPPEEFNRTEVNCFLGWSLKLGIPSAEKTITRGDPYTQLSQFF